MTTIYIEEVTDDEDSQTIDNDDTDHYLDDSKQKKTSSDKREKFQMQYLQNCPSTISGGASITTIGKKAFVFGGCDRTGKLSNGLHCYNFDTNEWECNLVCEGERPSPRFGHTAATFESKLYIFGGQGISEECDSKGTNGKVVETNHNLESFSSLFYLDVETFTWVKIDGSSQKLWPKCRNSHDSVILSSKLIVFGGANEEDGPMHDLWAYDLKLESWCELPANGTKPSGREMHTLTADHEKTCIYLFGGRMRDGTICQDLYVYKFGGSWTELKAPASPRCAHCTVLNAGRYLDTFGGWDGMGRIYSDYLSFDTEANAWSQIENIEEKEIIPRFAHCIGEYSNDAIVVAGGVNATQDLSDLAIVRKIVTTD